MPRSTWTVLPTAENFPFIDTLTVQNSILENTQPAYTCSFLSSIGDVQSADWNRLLADNNPFLKHEFLHALERNDCLGEKYGWYPHHLVVRDKDKRIIAASPLYIKTNSYGEFVFDWTWASAYEQVGLTYYPKFVASIPYTPVAGSRLLMLPGMPILQKDRLAADMIDATVKEAEQLNLSGTHWLFNLEEECEFYKRNNLMLRLGCQYHWHNRNYDCFNHFLEDLVSRKRKKIKRERRFVQDQQIRLQRLHGSDLDGALWQQVHSFYVDTFHRKHSPPTLTLDFFKELGAVMGSQIMLVLAYYNQTLIACAINFLDDDALYGRFWGCLGKFHGLHFEACYYQGIEYAIEHQLSSFEPGAQGEHKISRGFLPTRTWSAHWISDMRLRTAIQDFCQREKQFMQHECKELMSLSPYRLSSRS